MFLLKKYLSRIFFPLPLCCEMLVVGVLLLWLSKRQRLGKCLVSLGVLLLMLLSNGLVSELLLSPLESSYPPVADPSALNNGSEASVRWVVALGGGRTEHSRLVEGARIQKALPGSKLLLSIGYDDDSVAQAAIEMAQTIGLRREDITIIRDVRDTREEAIRMKQTIGEERFVLVTSASHMPRAMALFQSAGMNPQPAPMEYLIKDNRASYDYWLPSADNLYGSERAFYEYLGLLWLRLAG